MNIPKDVYEYLTNFADDKTIFSMLSVNKTFRDEEFFKRILKRKYPLLIPFKKYDKSWKEFYLEIIYYLSKLEENFDIPYIPTKDYNPKQFYENFKNDKSILDLAMLWAAKGGHTDVVKLMIQKGADNFYGPMRVAAYEGHMDIVKLMIEKGADNFNSAMYVAAKEGHMDIVKLMIEKGVTNFDGPIYVAAKEGHTEIVDYLKSLQ